jgi:hypothetical protein
MDLFSRDGKRCANFFFHLWLLTSIDIWCSCKAPARVRVIVPETDRTSYAHKTSLGSLSTGQSTSQIKRPAASQSHSSEHEAGLARGSLSARVLSVENARSAVGRRPPTSRRPVATTVNRHTIGQEEADSLVRVQA